MTGGEQGHFIDAAMLDLFRNEVEQQADRLTEGLMRLEERPEAAELIEPLMRAAHSIKGAARLVGDQDAARLAHVMEDCLVAAQHGRITLDSADVDMFLKGVDMLRALAAFTSRPGASMDEAQRAGHARLAALLAARARGADAPVSAMESALANTSSPPEARQAAEAEAEANAVPLVESAPPSAPVPAREPGVEEAPPASPGEAASSAKAADRVLRISAEQLNRLMGLAGESMVEARWMRPFAESLLRFKRQQARMSTMLDSLREAVAAGAGPEKVERLLREMQSKAAESRQTLADRLADIESYDRRVVNLSSRLRREVVASRMRPFGDSVQGFPRMVRDLARALDKQAQLVIEGTGTLVDRDILEKIEAPLNHLLRNALDHGLETPEEREQAGKPARGTVRLSAYHHAGMLSVVIEDDGRGVNIENLRRKVVEKNLTTAEMAAGMEDQELLDFMFLPNFSTRDYVTEISGRGVGLDVVHDVVQGMRGMVRASSQPGKGTRFQLQLPLTLSVIPVLLVEIAGEPYAFPLARIERILHVERRHIQDVGGHQYFTIGEQHVGLVPAAQVLGFGEGERGAVLPVVVLGERKHSYGVVVDRFLGERDVVVQVLPSRLGKVRDISAAALMENGAPLLIIDVDDLLRSIEKIVAAGRVNRVGEGGRGDAGPRERKRILVVDDSITVREVERKLLQAAGYEVEVAVDGMDGWNALREGEYDLVITDIDMPRLDGVELVRMIRQHDNYRKIPVMIVSYKEREEDRYRGLEAGADYYLTKGSFHDETLREAVMDLIGAGA